MRGLSNYARNTDTGLSLNSRSSLDTVAEPLVSFNDEAWFGILQIGDPPQNVTCESLHWQQLTKRILRAKKWFSIPVAVICLSSPYRAMVLSAMETLPTIRTQARLRSI
jgi:hypothetical protein